MNNPKDLTINISVCVPDGMNFMRVARAVQQFANNLRPGAKISHGSDGFKIDATIHEPEDQAA